MKKFVKIISIVICVVVAAMFAIACSEHGAPDYDTDNPSYVTTDKNLEKDLSDELGAFMTQNPNRTTYTEAEKNAALYISNRLLEFGFTDVTVQDFTVSEGDVSNLASQNVVAHLKTNRTASTKNVVLGAYYDNRYALAYTGAAVDNAQGALCGGTGVATLLTVANYLINNKYSVPNDLDVTFVFFGASYVSVTGAEQFIREMSAQEYQNTVLMVELQRLGCDNVYAFCDARQTKREGFFDSIAEKNGLNVYKPTTKSPQLTGVSVLNGIPYYQWAHSGVYNVFFNENIPTLNLVGANWETLDMSDAESYRGDKISFTERDTLEVLKTVYPDYAAKMATAASLVLNSLADNDFITVMEYDKSNFPNTDILADMWIWYLIVLSVLIIAGGVMLGLCSYIRKKHPVPVAVPRRIKMAVFGMDYEEGNSGDMFMDFASDDIGEIFPGIPNNAPYKNDIDDIFPMQSDGVFIHEINEEQQPKPSDISDPFKSEPPPKEGSGQGEPATNADPFDLPPSAEPVDNAPPAKKPKPAKRTSQKNKKSQKTEDPKNGDGDDKSE